MLTRETSEQDGKMLRSISEEKYYYKRTKLEEESGDRQPSISQSEKRFYAVTSCVSISLTARQLPMAAPCLLSHLGIQCWHATALHYVLLE